MYRYLYIRLILIASFLLSIIFGYENLYLMQFDNVSRDYQLDYLSEDLPELIKDNFRGEDYLNILYAPKIIPVLYENNSSLNDGILINGKFISSYDNIIISFEAFDVNSWEKKAFRSYYCNIDDKECIENALLVCIKENILPLFCPYYDCLGTCKGDAVKDCSGQCNGSATKDCAGQCNGNAIIDCAGKCNGLATIDNCGNCNSDPNNDCVQDCSGEWGGDAFVNVCNMCVSGSTGVESSFGMDCLGNCGGNAYQDCNGDCLGDAFLNECNVCVGGNTDNPFNKGIDCEGNCFGLAVLDDCGICNGDNASCSDCLGVPFGNASIDPCGICDENPTNDCIRDCNGDFGGTAYINECNICVEGNTRLNALKGLDCNNECWGNAIIDNCGICNGDNSCEKVIKNSESIINKNIVNDIKKTYLHSQKIKYNFKEEKRDIIHGNDIDNNTKNLFSILDNIKYDFYNHQIGDVKNQFVNNRVMLEIPIHYSINDIFLDKFEAIPHFKKENDFGAFVYKINKNDFSISVDLEKHLSLMKYQVVPVLFFATGDDKIGSIIVNSWNDNYKFNIGTKYNIDIHTTNQFETMISIMPGEETISFIFDYLDLVNTYEIYLNEEDYNNFEYVYIDFFYEHSLELDLASYIAKTYKK